MSTQTSVLVCQLPLVSVNNKFSTEAGFHLSQTRGIKHQKAAQRRERASPLQKRPRLASSNSKTQASPRSLWPFPVQTRSHHLYLKPFHACQ